MSIKALVSIAQIAEQWQVHRRTVRRLLDEAGIPPVYLSRKKKGTVRYKSEDIQRFIEESTADSGARNGHR